MNGGISVLLINRLRLPVEPLFRLTWSRHLSYHLLRCSVHKSSTWHFTDSFTIRPWIQCAVFMQTCNLCQNGT